MKDFFNFAKDKLSSYRKTIKEPVFSEVYELVYGITEDVQRILAESFEIAKKRKTDEVSKKIIDEAIQTILRERNVEYSNSYEELNEKQRSVLKVIAKHKRIPLIKLTGETPISKSRSKEIFDTIRQLKEKRIISEYSSNNELRLNSPFIGIWLQNRTQI